MSLGEPLNINLYKLAQVGKAFSTKCKEERSIKKLHSKGALNEHQAKIYNDNVQNKYLKVVGVPLDGPIVSDEITVLEKAPVLTKKQVLNSEKNYSTQEKSKKSTIDSFFSHKKKAPVLVSEKRE